MALLLQAAELVLAHAAPSLQWVGYLSSTSVYGDWGGNWVDERSEYMCVLPCGSLAHMMHATINAKLMLVIVCISSWHLLTSCFVACFSPSCEIVVLLDTVQVAMFM